MWPFKKKYPDISTLPQTAGPDGVWSVTMVELEDGPLIIRLNEALESWIAHPQLTIKLGFALPLQNPVPGGLPYPEENEALTQIEDFIEAQVQQVTIGVHAMTNTNGVMKEFVFYITEGVDIKTLHESLNASVQTHEVQCIAERETNWETFRMIKKLANQGERMM